MHLSDSPLVQKLAAGRPAICMPIRLSRSIHILQMAKLAGFDAVYMDMEHSPIGLDAISALALPALSMGITPLVRVPSHAREAISGALEAGAAGVLVPHVDDAAQARAIVDAARFRPRGSRAMAGASPPLGYTATGDEGAAILEARTVVIVMIESLEGVRNAESIASVPGVDLLLVGSGDISDELGIHGRYDDPRIRTVYESVAQACRKHGRWLGVAGIKQKPELILELRRLGATFITSTTDESLLLGAVRAEGRALRESFVDVEAEVEA